MNSWYYLDHAYPQQEKYTLKVCYFSTLMLSELLILTVQCVLVCNKDCHFNTFRNRCFKLITYTCKTNSM